VIKNYFSTYKKHIDDRKKIPASKMKSGTFYIVKEYTYVDGNNKTYSAAETPIIYTLYVSKTKDVVHAVKVTTVNPQIIKRFFDKMVNEDTELIQMKGKSSNYFDKYVKKIPVVSRDSYRTYKLSGLDTVFELDMDVNEMTSKSKTVSGIDEKSQKQSK
jgi:hypothetical protein